VVNQDYKSAEWLVQDLIDVVSKDGALLLNIGPRADGTIPEPSKALLLDIGRLVSRERRGDSTAPGPGCVSARADRGP